MDLCCAVRTANFSLAEELLKSGRDPNQLSEGVSPVHLAVGDSDTEKAIRFTKLLLQFNANPNVRSEDGLTPVHVAASWGLHQTLELLLQNGGDPHVKDDDGLTASDHASESESCKEIISEYGDYLLYSDDDDDQSFTYTTSSMKTLDRNCPNFILDNDPEISFSFLRINDSSETSLSSNGSIESGNHRNNIPRRVSFKQSTPEQQKFGEYDLQLIEESSPETSLLEDTLISLETGQGINVTSPDHLYIFNKFPSRDSRKTNILESCHVGSLVPSSEESSPELNSGEMFKHCRLSEIPSTESFSLCCAGGDASVISRRSILKPPSSRNSEIIEYLYSEKDTGVSFIETQQLPKHGFHELSFQDTSQSSTNATIIYDWKSFVEEDLDEPEAENKGVRLIPPELEELSNKEIMARLRLLGEEPGPVTNTTRKVYLALLSRLEDPNDDYCRVKSDVQQGFKHELLCALQGKPLPDHLPGLEIDMVQQFQQPDPRRKWREGIFKSNFNYILLDPRVSRNLPIRCQSLTSHETFKSFASAIFYIGKGKRARPYAHFYEALAEETADKKRKKKKNAKVKHIQEIWASGLGVVSLHIFQNVIPVEAYTREACMVDALGLSRLTNIKKGDYYGVASTWNAVQKRTMGVFLIQKACKIFLIEGERQIRPVDIGIGQ